METNFNECSFTSLTDDEQRTIHGGSPWIIFGAIVMVIGFVNTVAFGIGYLAGSIAANIE